MLTCVKYQTSNINFHYQVNIIMKDTQCSFDILLICTIAIPPPPNLHALYINKVIAEQKHVLWMPQIEKKKSVIETPFTNFRNAYIYIFNRFVWKHLQLWAFSAMQSLGYHQPRTSKAQIHEYNDSTIVVWRSRKTQFRSRSAYYFIRVILYFACYLCSETLKACVHTSMYNKVSFTSTILPWNCKHVIRVSKEYSCIIPKT